MMQIYDSVCTSWNITFMFVVASKYTDLNSASWCVFVAKRQLCLQSEYDLTSLFIRTPWSGLKISWNQRKITCTTVINKLLFLVNFKPVLKVGRRTFKLFYLVVLLLTIAETGTDQHRRYCFSFLWSDVIISESILSLWLLLFCEKKFNKSFFGGGSSNGNKVNIWNIFGLIQSDVESQTRKL